jgi:hypothetical protein
MFSGPVCGLSLLAQNSLLLEEWFRRLFVDRYFIRSAPNDNALSLGLFFVGQADSGIGLTTAPG